MTQGDELELLRARVKALEEKVNGLRLGRRVLMNLICARERWTRANIWRLQREKERLRRRNRRFARALYQRHLLADRLRPDGS